MREYLKLLKNIDFLLLWFSQVVSQFGDKLNQMALIAWAYSVMPGSSFQMAKLIFFTIVPVFIIGPFAATAVDRMDYRKTMYMCDLLRALAVFSIPFLILPKQLILPVYLMVFISFSLTRLFIPAKMSIIPNIVDEEDLLPANSLLSLTGVIAAMLGLGLGGIMVQHLGIASGFYIDAGTFLFSAIAIYMIGTRYKARDVTFAQEAVGIWQVMWHGVKYVFKGEILKDLKEGLLYLFEEERIKHLIGLLFLLWTLLGGIYATGIVFIQESLGSATADLGILVVFLGLGVLSGTLLLGKCGKDIDRFLLLYTSLVGVCFFLFVFAVMMRFDLEHKFGWASLLIFLIGIAGSPLITVSQTIVHETANEEMFGRIFGVMEIIIHLAFVTAMFISSLLAESFSEGNILILWSGIGIGIGFDRLIRRIKLKFNG